MLQSMVSQRVRHDLATEQQQKYIDLKGKWKWKALSSVPTLCDPIDCTVYVILQARRLEWVAFPFTRGSSQLRNRTQISHITLANSEKPSGCGTWAEFISLAVSEPSSCPADLGWRGPGRLQGLQAPRRRSLPRCPGGSMTGMHALLWSFAYTAGRETRAEWVKELLGNHQVWSWHCSPLNKIFFPHQICHCTWVFIPYVLVPPRVSHAAAQLNSLDLGFPICKWGGWSSIEILNLNLLCPPFLGKS